MSLLQRLPAESLNGLPCSDGSAVITEIACGPAGDDWQWRLTMIGIGQHGVEFPTHEDMRRQFVPLDAPVEVTFPDGRRQRMERFAMAHFDHLNDPQACLPDAPTRTFNLKLRNGAQGELIARPLNGAMVLLAPLGWRWFVLLLSGQAKVIADHRQQTLAPGEMLWIDPIPGQPVRIEGGGEIVLARITAE